MFLPSTGLTCGTFCSNDGVFSSGTRMTVPDTSAGSSRSMSFSTATIEAYSVPCAPATSASTGPGFVPVTTATGIARAGSEPAGTARTPVAFWPDAADAVPTAMEPGSGATAEQTIAQNHRPTAPSQPRRVMGDPRRGYRAGRNESRASPGGLQALRPVENQIQGNRGPADGRDDNEKLLSVRRHIVRRKGADGLRRADREELSRRGRGQPGAGCDVDRHQPAVGRQIEELLAVAAPGGKHPAA